MLALVAAAALQFSGTTAQGLPMRFSLSSGVVTRLAIAATAGCGRLGPLTDVIRFGPIRVRSDRRFYGVAREVPARMAPQGDLAYVTGRFVSRRRASGVVRFRYRRQDPSIGVVACTGRAAWTAVAR